MTPETRTRLWRVNLVLWPVVVLVAAGAYLLSRLPSAPSPPQAPPTLTAARAPGTTPAVTSSTDPNRLRVQAYLARPPANAAPLDNCEGATDQLDCFRLQVLFIDMDWNGAWRGDLDAARAVAACLAEGCRGSVEVNPTAACAWTLAINDTADADLTLADKDNIDRRCGYLDTGHRLLAVDQGARISGRVHLRKLG
jgi:hypothetical protein